MNCKMRMAVVAALATTALLGGAGLATADSPNGGKVTTYADQFTGTGTTALAIRTKTGTPTDSGVNAGVKLKFLGECVNAGGLKMIKAKQLQPGGWGNKYIGYITREFTDMPKLSC